MDAGEAAKLIKSGDTVWVGALTSGAPQIVDAVTDRYEELENVRLVGDFSLNRFKCFESDKYRGHVEYDTLFLGSFERAYLDKGNIRANIVRFADSYKAISEVYQVNAMICEVTEPDEEGYMYYGCTGVAWNGKVADIVDTIIVQVNSNQRRVSGWKHRIHVSQVDAICRCDHSLYEYIQPPVSEQDQVIASYILPLIPDGATLQIGVGGVANAVAYGLIDKKHLGVHTEMLTESLVYLAKKGVIDKDRITAAFILGNQETYDYALTGIPKLGPVDEIISPKVAGNIPGFVAINGCMMADLTGQVCSETIGHRQYSGTGGQLDCIRSGNMSEGGRSFLCMPSRKKKKDGSYVSTICLNLPEGEIVTVPRTDVMYIVTEQGIANLYNRPVEERVDAMISIAHPDDRERLRMQAIEAGLIRN
jgi:acyl-CoA hydrolase